MSLLVDFVGSSDEVKHVLKLGVCLQHVSDFFITSANAALSKSDEPEKVCLAEWHVFECPWWSMFSVA